MLRVGSPGFCNFLSQSGRLRKRIGVVVCVKQKAGRWVWGVNSCKRSEPGDEQDTLLLTIRVKETCSLPQVG